MGGAGIGEGTTVGLDVHAARSVVTGLMDELSGEVAVRRAPHRTDDLVAWPSRLRRPLRVAYEAGPTGFGLAHAAGVDGLVAAPSLIRVARPAERGRKRDASDAELLGRALRGG